MRTLTHCAVIVAAAAGVFAAMLPAAYASNRHPSAWDEILTGGSPTAPGPIITTRAVDNSGAYVDQAGSLGAHPHDWTVPARPGTPSVVRLDPRDTTPDPSLIHRHPRF